MRTGFLWAMFAACLVAASSFGQVDDDDDELIQARGRLAMQNNCLMCHRAPIIVSQRLSPDQWKAEVTKMVGWGSPLPAEEQDVLIAYLTREFGEKQPKVRPSRITIRHAETALEGGGQNEKAGVNGTNGLSGNLELGKRLFIDNCGKCHGNDARGGELGTNLVDKPIIGHWADFRTLVREGRNRMPGFKQALDVKAESEILWWLENQTGPKR